jgi:hypothetical protein
MIKFVYIGDQINSESREFAFFDTISDTFIRFGVEIVFDSLEEFNDSAEAYGSMYTRCMRLIPDWYKNGFSGPNVGKEIRS